MTTRINRPQGFGRSSRMYECDGRQLPSVTTILGAINKPALINWAAKVERESILIAAGQLWEDIPVGGKMSRDEFSALLLERIGTTKQNQRLKDRAADIGTQIHALVEWEMRRELKQEVGPQPTTLEAAIWGAMAHDDWRKSVNMVPILIEQVVWSNKYGYAGTFDIMCEMDLPGGGRGRVLVDNKSGKAIYAEAGLQIAAYAEALIEMGHAEHPLAGLVVRVPKTIDDPKFETRFYSASELSGNFKTFLSTLELWKWLDANRAL